MEKLAQKLRKSSTDAELRLWRRLKNRNLAGFKFRRQHPIPPYIADFVCLEQKLIVELDGGQHAEQATRDAERTACLQSKGFRVIRFWNDDALKQTDVVLEEIFRQLNAPHPSPLHLAPEPLGFGRHTIVRRYDRVSGLTPASGERGHTN